MQLGFYFDQTRCTGCSTCVVACKDWHDVPSGPASWRRVTTIEKGNYPHLFVAFLSSACYHCIEPPCVLVCPADAITKRKLDGVVVVDQDACLACRMCREACPYDAPQFGAEKDARMQKCDLCLDRLTEGKKPICVASCPMRALDAGPLAVLEATYSGVKEAEGFLYSAEVGPSIVFTPKRDTEGLPVVRVEVAPL